MASSNKQKFTIQDWLSRSPVPSRPVSEIPPAWDALEPKYRLSADKIVEGTANERSGSLGYYISAAASALFVLTAAFYSLGFFSRFPDQFSSGIANAPRAAVLLSFQGKLDIQGPAGDNLKARAGLALPEGSRIQTAETATANLSLPAGVLLRLAPKTKFQLQTKDSKKPGLIRTHLKEGKVYSLVERLAKNEGFEIQTPTAIAGVRGTSFSVEATAHETKVQLVLGKVEVRPRNPKTEEASQWILDQYDKNYVRIGEHGGAKEYKRRVEENFADAKELDALGRLMDRPEMQRIAFDPEAVKRNLTVRKERHKLYSVIRLRDGTSIKGFIVAQTGHRLFVETKQKSLVLYASDIEEIRFLEE